MDGNIVPGLCADDDHSIEDEPNETLELQSFHGTFKIPVAQSHVRCSSFQVFENLGTIEKGSFGETFRGRDKISGEIFALKEYNFNLQEGVPATFIREIEILKVFKHTNVITYYGTVTGKKLTSNYQVLDLWDCSLEDLLGKKTFTVFAAYFEDVVKVVMKQFFEGLKYIHEHFIIHRNINCKNLLFTTAGVLKITGFSGSRFCNQPLTYQSRTFDAPPSETTGNMTPTVNDVRYRAPELLFGVKKYSFSVDMWSAGCIFARLLLKKHLFNGNSEIEVFGSIMEVLGAPSQQIWPGFNEIFPPWNIKNAPLTESLEIKPPSAKDLIKRLVIYYPNARRSAANCLRSSYFKEHPHACTLDHLAKVLKKVSLES